VSATELTSTESQAALPGSNRAAVVLRAAWLSVLLGLIIEVAVLIVVVTADSAGGVRAEIANAAERVSWPVIVCVAIVFAQSSGRAFTSASALPRLMGVAGLLAAPMTVALTKLLHKGMTTTLGIASASVDVQILLLIGLVRALEYGSLAGAIGLLQRRGNCRAWHCLVIGLTAGIAFGAIAQQLTVGRKADPGASDYLASALNEIILPMGCALILFASKIMADHVGAGRVSAPFDA
jgi:hypothetical protein